MKKFDIIQSKHVDHIENEKSILENLNHPFTVSFTFITHPYVQLSYDGFFQDSRFIYFASELLGGGDLFTYHRGLGNFNIKQTQ